MSSDVATGDSTRDETSGETVQNYVSRENQLINETTSVAGQNANEQLEDLAIPPNPPEEWRLNNFLLRIAASIDENDLLKMKELFRGTGIGGMRKKTREECDTCIKLFGFLRENMYITPNCMLYVNKLLYTVNRTDLLQEVVNYCRENGNVLHYHECPEHPEEGSSYVKFHVQGRDFRACTPQAVQRLRNVVANIVCAPPEVILMAGIERGCSLLVILMIPDVFVSILQELLERQKPLWELSELYVDIVYVREKVYPVKAGASEQCQVRLVVGCSRQGIALSKLIGSRELEFLCGGVQARDIAQLTDEQGFEFSETDQQQKLKNIYAQCKEMSSNLENCQLLSMCQKEKICQFESQVQKLTKDEALNKRTSEQLESRVHELTQQNAALELQYQKSRHVLTAIQTLMGSLQLMHLTSPDGRKSYIKLENKLNTAVERGMDMPFISKILRYNTLIVSAYLRETHLNQLRKIEMTKTKRRAELLHLQHETVTRLQSPEKLLCQYYSRLLLGKTLRINKSVVDILKQISNSLYEMERRTLESRYYWSGSDVVKVVLESDRSLFLMGLECKEAEVTQTQVQTATFIRKVLSDIDRYDLVEEFEGLLKQQIRLKFKIDRRVFMMDSTDSCEILMSFLLTKLLTGRFFRKPSVIENNFSELTQAIAREPIHFAY